MSNTSKATLAKTREDIATVLQRAKGKEGNERAEKAEGPTRGDGERRPNADLHHRGTASTT